MNIQTLNIEINDTPFKELVANLNENGRKIRINITNEGVPVNLEGVSVYLYAKKPDGTKIFNDVIIEDLNNGIVLAKLTKQMVSLVGNVKLTLLLVKGETKICTKIFKLNVEESIVDDEAIESTDEFGALLGALNKVESVENRLNNLIVNNNPTEGNSELIDLRVGADGVTYTSAGESVRTQFNNDKARIEKIENRNIEQDSRMTEIESKNKSQDIYLSGLLNEDNNGRLTIESSGNELKLEGSGNGLVTVDNIIGDSLVNLVKRYNYTMSPYASTSYFKDGMVKPNTKYTAIISNPSDVTLKLYWNEFYFQSLDAEIKPMTSKVFMSTSLNTFSGDSVLFKNRDAHTKVIEYKVILLEGDYTNKPIPTQAFEGIQSSFEDKLVTQEMIDSKEELAINLNKYKVNSKVIGKNKAKQPCRLDLIKYVDGKYIANDKDTNTVVALKLQGYCKLGASPVWNKYINTKITATGIYSTTFTKDNSINFLRFANNGTKAEFGIFLDISHLTNGKTYVFSVDLLNLTIGALQFRNIQIEEGTQVTSYEPYVEYEDNIYLNKPLLKGDELVSRDDGVYHRHNSVKGVLNGTEKFYKIIENDNFIYFRTDNMLIKPIHNYIVPVMFCDKFTVYNNEDLSKLTNEGITTGNLGGQLNIVISKSKLVTPDVDGFKAWLKTNPVTVVYELNEPQEEKVHDDKLLCEISNDSTLQIGSNIPIVNLKATYTSNVMNLYDLNNVVKQKANQSDLEIEKLRIDKVEEKNKSQDVYLNGLFNEDDDARLTNQGVGNELKLEGSKSGLVTVDSITGDSLVNLKTTEFKYALASSNNNSYFKLVSNSTTNIKGTILDTTTNLGLSYAYINFMKLNTDLLKPSTTYTIVLDNKSDYLWSMTISEGSSINNYVKSCLKVSQNIYVIVTKDSFADLSPTNVILYGQILGTFKGDIDTTVIGILEGDYTNKPIPSETFTGIQSSFENKLITQDMVDNKEELAINLGKYKVNCKSVGKNIFNINKFQKRQPTTEITISGNTVAITDEYYAYVILKVKRNTDYYFSTSVRDGAVIVYGSSETQINTSLSIKSFGMGNGTFNTGNRDYIAICFYSSDGSRATKTFRNIQLEEATNTQTSPTEYEPYFECEREIYLNSPLLKGDELVSRNDGVYHIHNSEKAMINGSENKWIVSDDTMVNTTRFVLSSFLPNKVKNDGYGIADNIAYTLNAYGHDVEGMMITNPGGHVYIRKNKMTLEEFKSWLQANPITVLYELNEPWEEKVSDDKFVCEIANNSTLTLDSNIPVTSVKAKYTSNIVSVVKLDKIQYEQDRMAIENAYKLSVLSIMTGVNI